MATFNGVPYVQEQIASILDELGRDDEVVVVDDCSEDSTVSVLRAIRDPRVKIHTQEVNLGHVKTFERAIGLARGDLILFADQDDIWVAGRVEKITRHLREGAVVASNLRSMEGQPTAHRHRDLRAREKGQGLRCLWRLMVGTIPYYGCAMGLRADFLDVAMPFPRFAPSHDLWIAIAANVAGEMSHLEDVTVHRRVHTRNISAVSRRSLPSVALSRWRFLCCMLVAARRSFRVGRLRKASH
ncbi:glycosyltransferase [Actinopolymorpha sp. B9G3]|uniref:glycosyltransferase n=1 Tax=Actinopolymorpha sp. B9G3 TaxID=3158970 RepID=UPI0032D9AC39